MAKLAVSFLAFGKLKFVFSCKNLLQVVLGLFALLALSFAGEVRKSAEGGDLKTASSYGLGFGYGGFGWGVSWISF